MKKRPFQLVPDTISTDTVSCLEALLSEARQGSVIGLAFVAMFKGRTYIVNTAGECHRNRAFTRGMVADLNDKLGAPL